MPPSIGTRLGAYEILGPLGAGGMGEVYRARDTKLGRDVALKILPELFAADADRLARFQREAQVLAALNHAHIGHIYGLEDSSDVRALVLELVEGPTLADRISQGAIPLDEAVPIARQIAEALEVAHEQGIVHRDLKPANIKVRDDGAVKVLDFGLAKALDPDPVRQSVNAAASPTISMAAMTQVGLILGTAAYMSPEQAHGRSADRRADIFSFGAVLFEMLSGAQAFTGESVGETLASVLKTDPDWSRLPRTTPASIRRLLERCLTKDASRRLQAIGEARIVLEQPIREDAPTTPRPALRGWSAAWPIATALTAIVAGVALWGWLKPERVEPRPVLRFDGTLDLANTTSVSLSRDGSRLAYVGGPERTIHVRLMDGGETRSIPGTETASSLSFSPDGQWISFVGNAPGSRNRQLKKVAVAGGPAQTLVAQFSTVAWTPAPRWADDGYIYFGGDGPLQRISSTGGGQLETIASPDPQNNEKAFSHPQLLPGGTAVLATILGPRGGGWTVAVDLKTRNRKVLLDRAGMAQYVPSRKGSGSGHLLFYDAPSGSLLAALFDARQLQVQGSLVPVVEGIQSASGPFGKFSVSDAGILAYAPGAGFSSRTLVWVDRQGGEEPTASPVQQYNLPRLSPDGSMVATEIQDPVAGTAGVWIYDLVRKALSPFATDEFNASPVWTPDGKRVVYSSTVQSQHVVLSAPADRSGPPTQVGKAGNLGLIAQSVAGDAIIGISSGTAWMLPLSAPSSTEPAAFLESKPRKQSVEFSRDGHLVAYAAFPESRTAQAAEIHVTVYPGPGGHLQISTDGGTLPRWRHDGRELFYWSRGRMMAVDIERGTAVRASPPKVLFEGSYGNGFDVAPDGRFLMIKSGSPLPAAKPNQVTFVVNWFQELNARVPAK